MSLREHLVNEAGGTDRILPIGYKQETPMSGEEIAQALFDQGITKKKITRQAVSNTLKRAMDKVFVEMKKANPDLDAFEIAAALATGCTAEEQFITGCYGYLPNIRLGKLIYENATMIGPPIFSDEEKKFASDLQNNYWIEMKDPIHEGINFLK